MTTALILLEGVAIVLLGVLVAGLLRSHAEILRRLHALGAGLEPSSTAAPVGAPHDEIDFGVQPGVAAPREEFPVARDLVGVTPDDEAIAVGVVDARHDTLIAFLSSGCSTCAGFWSAFGNTAQQSLPAGVRLAIVTKGPDDESESAIRALAPADVPLVMSTPTWLDYEVPVSPYFVLVQAGSGRVVGEGAASRWEQVADLLRQATADTVSGQRRRAVRPGSGPDREERANAELMAAGIHPGHPSLYPRQDADIRSDGDRG